MKRTAEKSVVKLYRNPNATKQCGSVRKGHRSEPYTVYMNGKFQCTAKSKSEGEHYVADKIGQPVYAVDVQR